MRFSSKKSGFKNISLLVSLVLFLMCSQSVAQDGKGGKLYIGTELNTSLNGFDEELPFWLHANKNGIYDQRSANGLLYARFNKPLISDDDFSISASGKLYGRAADQSTVGINMLSGTVKYKFLKLKAGKFEDPLGMNYHPLSSGSMLYSTNAEPVPKIALQTDGFVNVPLAQGYVQFASYLSHGWFEDSRYIKNAYLHQKYLYLKINYKMFEGIGGVVHNVQWGGIHPQYGQLLNSFSDYLRMFFSRGAKEGTSTPGAEITNSLGNSVAGYDFNLRVNLNRFQLTFYRLFYLEDKVSSRFRSPWDGMWGGGIIRSVEKPFLKALLYEHINTKRQDSFEFEPRGTANYYNNVVYRSGWSYKNRILGTPLILTNGSNTTPVYNSIIIAHHLGVNGYLTDNIAWKGYYTFSRNYGHYTDQIIEIIEPGVPIRAELRDLEELKKVNHSLFVGAEYSPPQNSKLNLKLGLALDAGELYPETRVGIIFGCSYRLY